MIVVIRRHFCCLALIKQRPFCWSISFFSSLFFGLFRQFSRPSFHSFLPSVRCFSRFSFSLFFARKRSWSISKHSPSSRFSFVASTRPKRKTTKQKNIKISPTSWFVSSSAPSRPLRAIEWREKKTQREVVLFLFTNHLRWLWFYKKIEINLKKKTTTTRKTGRFRGAPPPPPWRRGPGVVLF